MGCVMIIAKCFVGPSQLFRTSRYVPAEPAMGEKVQSGLGTGVDKLPSALAAAPPSHLLTGLLLLLLLLACSSLMGGGKESSSSSSSIPYISFAAGPCTSTDEDSLVVLLFSKAPRSRFPARRSS